MKKQTFTKTQWETKKFKGIRTEETKGWFNKKVNIYIKRINSK